MKRLVCLAAAALILTGLGMTPVQAQINLKAGHISPKDSPDGIAIDRFAELVKNPTPVEHNKLERLRAEKAKWEAQKGRK